MKANYRTPYMNYSAPMGMEPQNMMGAPKYQQPYYPPHPSMPNDAPYSGIQNNYFSNHKNEAPADLFNNANK